MKKLHANWVTEGLIDFEYKKYILLAYLKKVKEKFRNSQLYPFMGDLVFHYNNLLTLRRNKDLFIEDLPREISAIDLKKLKIVYREIMHDDELMEEIFAVVHYALPKIKEALDEGKDLYELVENQMELEPVGILPLYKNEGYLLITESCHKDVFIFRYSLSSISASQERYFTLSTEYIYKERLSLANTTHQVKLNLIRRFDQMPNPATYNLVSKLHFPLKSTLLPIGERMLIRHLAA